MPTAQEPWNPYTFLLPAIAGSPTLQKAFSQNQDPLQKSFSPAAFNQVPQIYPSKTTPEAWNFDQSIAAPPTPDYSGFKPIPSPTGTLPSSSSGGSNGFLNSLLPIFSTLGLVNSLLGNPFGSLIKAGIDKISGTGQPGGQTGSGSGGGVAGVATSAAAAIAKLMSQGVSQSTAELIVNSIDPKLLAAGINPTAPLPNITEALTRAGIIPGSPEDIFGLLGPGPSEETPGMLPASQAGDLAGLGPGGVEVGSSALAPDALASLGSDIANSSVGQFLGTPFTSAENFTASLGLPAGLGIFGAGAGVINSLVHGLMSLFPMSSAPHQSIFAKKVEDQIAANPQAWVQKIAQDYGPQFGPYAAKMGQFATDVITGKAQNIQDFRKTLGIPDWVPDEVLNYVGLFQGDPMGNFGSLSTAAGIEANVRLPDFLKSLPFLTPERPYMRLGGGAGSSMTKEEAAMSGLYPSLEPQMIASGRFTRDQNGDLKPRVVAQNADEQQMLDSNPDMAFRRNQDGDLVPYVPKEQGE